LLTKTLTSPHYRALLGTYLRPLWVKARSHWSVCSRSCLKEPRRDWVKWVRYVSGELPAVPFVPKNHEHRLDRLTVRGLGCRHADTGRGVTGIDLELHRGSFTVVTGQVASGKTTLRDNILMGLPEEAVDLGSALRDAVLEKDIGRLELGRRW
jgi:hypothetical protein